MNENSIDTYDKSLFENEYRMSFGFVFQTDEPERNENQPLLTSKQSKANTILSLTIHQSNQKLLKSSL